MSLYSDFLTDTADTETFSTEWFRKLALLVKDLEEDVDTIALGGVGGPLDFGTFALPVEFSVNMGAF